MMLTPRQAVWTVLGALAGVLLLIVVIAVVVSAAKSSQVRASQQQNTPLIESTSRTLELVEDCTTPGRECYERAQEQTAGAVESINRAVIYAAACADQPGVQGQDEIYACVIRRMARDDAGPR